jgi:hypothetical protein
MYLTERLAGDSAAWFREGFGTIPAVTEEYSARASDEAARLRSDIFSLRTRHFDGCRTAGASGARRTAADQGHDAQELVFDADAIGRGLLGGNRRNRRPRPKQRGC